MNPVPARRLAALFGLLAVALGAFGAHGLEDKLLVPIVSRASAEKPATAQATPVKPEKRGLEIWHTAVLYHIVHAVALLALAQRARVQSGPFWCFVLGILLFSGSLYPYALWHIRWLAFVTPFGGLVLLIGWLWMLVAPARE